MYRTTSKSTESVACMIAVRLMWHVLLIYLSFPGPGSVVAVVTVGGNANGASCAFPFNFGGTLYSKCIIKEGVRLWCATTSDYDVDKKWGYCPVKSTVKTKEGEFCYFPFVYDTVVYTACIVTSTGGKQWCPTTDDYGRDNKWDYCEKPPEGESTIGGNGGGANCVFPFIYKDVERNECITPVGKEAWCATTDNFDRDHLWGVCKSLITGDITCDMCENGASCLQTPSATVFCLCADGFYGRVCSEVDHCYGGTNVCKNGGTCDTLPQHYQCLCTKGYVRDDCSVYSPCNPNVCQHGGSCARTWHSYRCTCATGYIGTDCETKVNCAFAPCLNGGTCEELINGYRCTCVGPFYGKDCENKPVCDPNPCLNNGLCIKITDSDYECQCSHGYSGAACEIVYYCQLNSCQNDGTCEEMKNGFTCHCLDGFVGTNCERVYNPCERHLCANGAQCVGDVTRYSGYRCHCSPGFTGMTCTKVITKCEDGPCLNDGVCSEKQSGSNFTCTCADGVKGRFCEIKPLAKPKKVTPDDAGYKDFLTAFFVIFPVCVLVFCFAFVYFVRRERRERVYARSMALLNDAPPEELPPTGYAVIITHVLAVMFCFANAYRAEAVRVQPPVLTDESVTSDDSMSDSYDSESDESASLLGKYSNENNAANASFLMSAETGPVYGSSLDSQQRPNRVGNNCLHSSGNARDISMTVAWPGGIHGSILPGGTETSSFKRFV